MSPSHHFIFLLYLLSSGSVKLLRVFFEELILSLINKVIMAPMNRASQLRIFRSGREIAGWISGLPYMAIVHAFPQERTLKRVDDRKRYNKRKEESGQRICQSIFGDRYERRSSSVCVYSEPQKRREENKEDQSHEHESLRK